MLYDESKSQCPPRKQTHVHEIQGSVDTIAIKKPYHCKDKKEPNFREDTRDSYYDCDKDKEDPCYDYKEDKKAPYYEFDRDGRDSFYENEDRESFYENDKDGDDRKNESKIYCFSIEAHNHRFALVSGEAIPVAHRDHIHEVKFRTDFSDGHYHVFSGKTGGAIPVGGGRHIHFLEAQTSFNNGHRHKFKVATLIEDPSGDC